MKAKLCWGQPRRRRPPATMLRTTSTRSNVFTVNTSVEEAAPGRWIRLATYREFRPLASSRHGSGRHRPDRGCRRPNASAETSPHECLEVGSPAQVFFENV